MFITACSDNVHVLSFTMMDGNSVLQLSLHVQYQHKPSHKLHAGSPPERLALSAFIVHAL